MGSIHPEANPEGSPQEAPSLRFWPSRDEVNACAAAVALASYSSSDGFLLDHGARPDFIRIRDNYRRRFSTPTVYERYVQKGLRAAWWKKLTGQKIEWPSVSLSEGSHIVHHPGGGRTIERDGRSWSDPTGQLREENNV